MNLYLTLQMDFVARWCMVFCKSLIYWTSLPTPGLWFSSLFKICYLSQISMLCHREMVF